MATSPSQAVVLGKRNRTRRPSELVLHLSGGSQASLSPTASSFAPSQSGCESEYSLESDDISVTPIASPSKSFLNSKAPVIVNGTLVQVDDRRWYRCTYDGCDKSYKKPSRLQEHERSHTGERPFVCATCSKSYLRESHLQAHARSHMPESARPLLCRIPDCAKRFWTNQHRTFHEDLHAGDKPFKCTETNCNLGFSKHGKLRAHIASAHCPSGTKPFRCEHPACSKSFLTSQKLRAHIKTHDDKRYTCAYPECLANSEQKMYFATWTSLQSHIRQSHPATCPYASCNGKTFSAQKGLKAHLKIHEQREIEDALLAGCDGDDSDGEEGGEGEKRMRKRRRGGEVGRDWNCEFEGCEKDFKSKKAMATHYKVAHLQRRDFICEESGCGMAFGYKHLLQRHQAKLHSQHHSATECDDGGDADDEERDGGKAQEPVSFIDMITGKAYADRATARLSSNNGLRCPHPNLPANLLPSTANQARSPGPHQGEKGSCEYVFSRAYDLRRHLRAAHGVEVAKERAEDWVRSEKEKADNPH